MPFAHVLLWAHPLHGIRWHEGFPLRAQKLEYREMYDLVAHLLKTYSGSGRTFYLGYWEGDGILRGGFRCSLRRYWDFLLCNRTAAFSSDQRNAHHTLLRATT